MKKVTPLDPERLDLSKVLSDMAKLYKKDKPKIGLGTSLRKLADTDFLMMPEWWKQATNTKGLPYGKIVMVAGDSDSGKTSCAIQAMKAAQEQNVTILYIETEGKTTEQDFVNWGVDPSNIVVLQSSVAEDIYDEAEVFLDAFFGNNPKAKLLLVFDSLGSVVSKRDRQLKLATESQKPGGKGATNRLGIMRLISRREESDMAILIINYTYDNIGSPGKTNAGGKAVNFFSSLTYQTTRKSWFENTVKGEKVRSGAIVRWKLFKNHIDKSNPGPKVVDLKITAAGIEVLGASDED